jgi:hypothetical protein
VERVSAGLEPVGPAKGHLDGVSELCFYFGNGPVDRFPLCGAEYEEIEVANWT